MLDLPISCRHWFLFMPSEKIRKLEVFQMFLGGMEKDQKREMG